MLMFILVLMLMLMSKCEPALIKDKVQDYNTEGRKDAIECAETNGN